MCKYCAKKISEAAATLTTLKAAKTKKRVSFPVNIVLQQAITDGDKEEVKKTCKVHGKKRARSQGPHWNAIVTPCNL